MRGRTLVVALLGALCIARDAGAQLDPLLYVKKNKPNVLIAVETANRMQRDVYNDYIDDNVYRRLGTLASPVGWETALGVNDTNTNAGGTYRRKYVGLRHRNTGGNTSEDRFEAAYIDIVGDKETAEFAAFDYRPRIVLARKALIESVAANTTVARFSLFRTRQQSPRFLTPADSPAVKWQISPAPTRVQIRTGLATTPEGEALANAQDDTGDIGSNKWTITRPVVGNDASDADRNGAVTGPVGPLAGTAADLADSNTKVLGYLNLATGATDPSLPSGSLLPAGRDDNLYTDAPVDNMLEDLLAEAARLIKADPNCANTVAILVVGGRDLSEDPVTTAKKFANVVVDGVSSGRRVPIHVIGIAPLTDTDRTQLTNIATESGGRFTEITVAMFEAAGAGNPIPEFVQAINYAVSQAFGNQSEFNQGKATEHQITSPIIGTVNLENAKDIDGVALPNTIVNHQVDGKKLPQRSNVLVTAAFSLPGYDGKLRAFRVYKPEVDKTKTSGYKFVADGTKLWVASAPAAASRNIYTALPNGTVVAFSAANALLLQPYLRTTDVASTTALIDSIRGLGCSATQCPIGAIVGSTPAVQDPPSLDPPPDSDYPAFVNANKDRRSMVWVGSNAGMLHAIDARLGKEVWAFIPFNLLPKLKAFRMGQPTGDFRFGMDGSPKLADVKVDGQWRSYLVVGQGAGGTFYQTFDVTLPDMAATVGPTSDSLSDVLAYFASPNSVPLKWAFPSYTLFDVNLGQWGDIAASADPIYKTVGYTWSDPAVGQIENATSPFTVLTGSGFFPYTAQTAANRGGVVAGTTFYVLDVKDGALLDSEQVTTDGLAEDVDNCAAINDCRALKNALQADPVATGPSDSRYINRVYTGDLDGRIWRFDLGLDGITKKPFIKDPLVKLYTVDSDVGPANEHPVFASMATVSIGTTQQYLFVGTGSDLLPQNSVDTAYALLIILDQGTTGARKAMIKLEKTDGTGGDEKVSAFPAVAGDIVFFSTTTYTTDACAVPTGNLYAFTFIGGPAYDTNNDGKLSSTTDSVKIASTAGRATAPFIVDQHLVFGVGNTFEMFGDPSDFNNGVGQAGVRILSWREVR